MTRLLFMGTPDFSQVVVQALWENQARGWDVVGVVTRPDKPSGRGRQVLESPVKQFALAHHLPVQQPRTLRRPEALADLAAWQPDLIVVAAYGLILPRTVLDLPCYGCINVHASLLPRHRGAAPVAGALLAGDTQTGTTIMLMDEGMDTGPLLSQAVLEIAAGETRDALMGRLAEQGAHLLVDTLPGWLAGEIESRAQPAAGVTLTQPIDKSAGRIEWAAAADVIARQVRAYHPWPGAFTSWQGKLLKIRAARAAAAETVAMPGLVLQQDGEVSVACGSGRLVLVEVQIEGKRSLDALTFVRGQRGFVGSVLGD